MLPEIPSPTLTTKNHDYRHCFFLFTHFGLHHHIIICLLFYSFYRYLVRLFQVNDEISNHNH